MPGMAPLGLASLALLSSLLGATSAQKAGDNFDPYSYKKSFATCNAVERSGSRETPISLKLAYLDINPTANKTLVMVHGWPSLWTTYRHQISGFGKDYRLIIPENRGFGDSQHPKDLSSSNAMFDFVNDIVCMMDHAKAKSGVCVGNDFGAQVCWEAGRSRPDRFTGVFNVGIPYMPSGGMGGSQGKLLARQVRGNSMAYQIFLGSNPTGAAKELDADPRSAIRSCARIADGFLPKEFLTKTTTFLGPWYDYLKEKNLQEIPMSGIMTKRVEDYMVESYKKQGFYNTFNGYQSGNQRATSQFQRKQGNFTLPQPTFTLFPTKDAVANWAQLATMIRSASYLKVHSNKTIVTAHWPHEERPEEFNAILRDWLRKVNL